jgi:hypothetical protein
LIKTVKPTRAMLAMLAMLTVGTPAMLCGQGSRRDLVTRALGEFDPVRQRELLRAALNPNLGPPDSLFGISVQYLAQNLLEAGQDSLASVWLKWAIRLAPEMSADTLQFPQSVVSAYRNAETEVRAAGEATQPTTATSWEWPALAVGEGPGSLRVVRSASAATPQILVQGVGLLNLNERVSLAAGTYNVQGTAAGHVPANVAVEILPGVTTVLTLDLVPRGGPVIAGDVESNALSRLVRITAFRLGEPSCGTGFFAGRDGLVLTTYRAIRGAEGLQIEASDGAIVAADVQVAAHDVTRNVAVVKAPLATTDSLVLAEDVPERSYVWGLNHPDCGPARSAATRLAGTVGATIQLEGTVAEGEQGGPIIDNSGAVVGLGTGPTAVLPIASARAILEQARRNVLAGDVLAPQQVAARENHLYGRVDLRSAIEGATASVTPLEAWQWAAAARTDSLPFVFTGPMGRYRVDLMLADELREQTEMQVQPGQLIGLSLALGGGGKTGLIVGVVGGLGVAGGLLALLAGGGDNGPPPPPPTEFGSITITFPNN